MRLAWRSVTAYALSQVLLVQPAAEATRPAAGLELAVVAPPAASPSAHVRLGGHVLPALARARPAPPPLRRGFAAGPEDEPLSLTIVLRRGDESGFQRFLADVYDSASPRYLRFAPPAEIADRFGPSVDAYEAVRAYLTRSGFSILGDSTNRLTITAAGTRVLAERAFGVTLGDYELAGRRFLANDRDPSLPSGVGEHVQSIVGLSTLARAEALYYAKQCWQNPNVSHDNAAFCVVGYAFLVVCYALACLALLLSALYTGGAALAVFGAWALALIFCGTLAGLGARAAGGSPSPLARSVTSATGAGQKIGVTAFSGFQTSDVADFLALLGLPSTHLSRLSEVKVNGGASVGAGESEVLLDVNEALLFAPGADVVVYDAPFGGAGSFQALFNQMVTDGVTVISNSWAYCEDQTTLADVQSIDSILAAAAASGISVFSASGDTGSTCLDGTPSTIGVPADSPHATAVGGTTPVLGPADLYVGERWWQDQGGFGTSRFFSRPAYQNGHTAASARSVPDVVAVADPQYGLAICQADNGGCPNGLLYGGTSMAAPFWAALTARLADAQGHALGLLNPTIYPLAGTAAFRGPGAMLSDFAHVGLGSPSASALNLLLAGAVAGPGDAAQSAIAAAPPTVPADGTASVVVVQLRDANGSGVPGKTVTLAQNAGGHASLGAANGPSAADGSVFFSVSDTTIEDVTLTAHDDTDGVTISQTADVHFVAPAATAGGIGGVPTTVTANGTATTTVTVTLTDAHGNGAIGKTVTLDQGAGRSHVTGPSPAVTDGNGQVTFTATDVFTEDVTYRATDVTDGDLAVPGSVVVHFVSGGSAGCALGQETPSAGWLVTSVVTGFKVDANCVGVSGTAWDPAGNLFAIDYGDYHLYRFPAGTAGALADGSTRITASPYAPGSCPHGLAFSKDGTHLYLARQFCGSGGDVVEISAMDGHVVRSVAPANSIPCATGVATDPVSGDLFVTTPCGPANLYRITNPDSPTPGAPVAYAPSGLAIGINFTPDGTIWTEGYSGTGHVLKIAGTASGSPGTVTTLTSAPAHAGGVLALFDASSPGSPPALFVSDGVSGSSAPAGVEVVDLTQDPAVTSAVTTGGTGQLFVNAGPDGCAYVSSGDRIDRITAADGSCAFARSAAAAALTLSPVVVVPGPQQGTPRTFTAQLSGVAAAVGTPVAFDVTGANGRFGIGHIDASGKATYTYAGILAGTDDVVARITVNATTYVSNHARVVWSAGKHTTALSLGATAGGVVAATAALKATLTDLSLGAPLAGASVHFALGAQSCDAVTNGSGVASCGLTPSTPGLLALTASYAGDGSHLPSSDATPFEVVGALRGDANGNGARDVIDVFYLINALFAGGAPPANACRGDVNADGNVDVLDVFALINFLFAGGPPPPPC